MIFVYDSTGARIGEFVVGGSSTIFQQDENNSTGYSQVLQQSVTAGSNTTTNSYILGMEVLGQSDGTTTGYFLFDGHGSNRGLINTVNGHNDLTQIYVYDAFGITISLSQLAATTTTYTLTMSLSQASTNILYTGQFFDFLLGQYLLRARYYNPMMGEFLSQDIQHNGSTSDPISLHKYLYADGDPIMGSDPTGHFDLIELAVDSAITAAFGAIIAPIVKPAGAFVANTIVNALMTPDTLANMVNAVNSAPPALMVGADFLGGVGYSSFSLTAGITVESLLSPAVHEGYWASDYSFSNGGTGSMRGSAAGKAGDVF